MGVSQLLRGKEQEGGSSAKKEHPSDSDGSIARSVERDAPLADDSFLALSKGETSESETGRRKSGGGASSFSAGKKTVSDGEAHEGERGKKKKKKKKDGKDVSDAYGIRYARDSVSDPELK